MEIGLLLHTRQLIRQDDALQSFQQLWSDAMQAEELGFDHIWLGDSVTVLDKARGDCLTTMAAPAARTSRSLFPGLASESLTLSPWSELAISLPSVDEGPRVV